MFEVGLNKVSYYNNSSYPRFGNTITPISAQTKIYWDKPVTLPQSQEKKDSINVSKIIKWGAGIALTAGIIALAIKRNQFAPLKNLSGNIKFRKAKTFDEAIRFGQETFGIKSYKGFEPKDLNVLNWFNEGLVNVSNALKGKNVRVPKYVIFSDEMKKNALACVSNKGILAGKFAINKSLFRNIDKEIKKILKGMRFDDVLEGKSTYLDVFTKESRENLVKQVKLYKKGKIKDFALKVKLHENLRECNHGLQMLVFHPDDMMSKIMGNPAIVKRLKEKGIKIDFAKFKKLSKDEQKNTIICIMNKAGIRQIVNTNKSPFGTIYHEMGHLQDIIPRVHAKGDFASASEYPKALKEWLSDKKIQNIASRVSNYAATGPAEFIAETFSGLLDGTKYTKEVINLYKKMNGPMLSSISA